MSSALSEFEIMVLRGLLSGDPEERELQAQLREATVQSRDYTDVGLFTKFAIPRSVPRLSVSYRYIEQVPKTHLAHPELKNGAGVLLWFEDGYLSTLECYAYEEQWPDSESDFAIDARTNDV